MPSFTIKLEVFKPGEGFSKKNFRSDDIIKDNKNKKITQKQYKEACLILKKHMDNYNRGIRGNQWYENK